MSGRRWLVLALVVAAAAIAGARDDWGEAHLVLVISGLLAFWLGIFRSAKRAVTRVYREAQGD